MEKRHYFVKAVGLFGVVVANWLFLTQFLAVINLCRYILIDEMRDGFSVAPIVLSIAVAFCVLSVSLALVINGGSESIRIWLFTIPLAILIQVIPTAILTAANSEGMKANSQPDVSLSELFPGSESDEMAKLHAIALTSNLYNWTLMIYLAMSFGCFWYFMLGKYKENIADEQASKNID